MITATWSPPRRHVHSTNCRVLWCSPQINRIPKIPEEQLYDAAIRPATANNAEDFDVKHRTWENDCRTYTLHTTVPLTTQQIREAMYLILPEPLRRVAKERERPRYDSRADSRVGENWARLGKTTSHPRGSSTLHMELTASKDRLDTG